MRWRGWRGEFFDHGGEEQLPRLVARGHVEKAENTPLWGIGHKRNIGKPARAARPSDHARAAVAVRESIPSDERKLTNVRAINICSKNCILHIYTQLLYNAVYLCKQAGAQVIHNLSTSYPQVIHNNQHLSTYPPRYTIINTTLNNRAHDAPSCRHAIPSAPPRRASPSAPARRFWANK